MLERLKERSKSLYVNSSTHQQQKQETSPTRLPEISLHKQPTENYDQSPMLSTLLSPIKQNHQSVATVLQTMRKKSVSFEPPQPPLEPMKSNFKHSSMIDLMQTQVQKEQSSNDLQLLNRATSVQFRKQEVIKPAETSLPIKPAPAKNQLLVSIEVSDKDVSEDSAEQLRFASTHQQTDTMVEGITNDQVDVVQMGMMSEQQEPVSASAIEFNRQDSIQSMLEIRRNTFSNDNVPQTNYHQGILRMSADAPNVNNFTSSEAQIRKEDINFVQQSLDSAMAPTSILKTPTLTPQKLQPITLPIQSLPTSPDKKIVAAETCISVHSHSEDGNKTDKTLAQCSQSLQLGLEQVSPTKTEQSPTKTAFDSDSNSDKSLSKKKRKKVTIQSLQLQKEKKEQDVKTCWHYERKCRLKCEECQTFYPCRICHDMRNYNEQHAFVKPSHAQYGAASAQVSQFKAIKEKIGQVNGSGADNNDPWVPHTFNPKKVQKLICNNCSFIQAPSKQCKKCKITFGLYFCEICLLYDNDTAKSQWHCVQCGVCKVGGKQNHFHCETCKACIRNEFANQHEHDNTKVNCSVCEDVADKQHPSLLMKLRCGHVIHRHCFRTLVESNQKCAVCEEPSIEHQQSLAQTLQKKLLPLALQKVRVKCDDCLRIQLAQIYVLGAKCKFCHSYRTRELPNF